jgi:DNA repair protein RadA/Sms
VSAKTRIQYVCQNCGYSQAKWAGRCPKCGEWNSFVEEVEGPEARGGGLSTAVSPVALPDVPLDGGERLRLPMPELERVLGGGIVPGSGVLISGDPGIGKSTLLIQMAAAVAQSGRKVLYVSGEESASR